MSEWENHRQRSWGYYACLLLLILPAILNLYQVFLTTTYLDAYTIVLFFLYVVLVIITVFGLGVRYQHRGINPASRNIINATDGHYFERIGADESDYS